MPRTRHTQDSVSRTLLVSCAMPHRNPAGLASVVARVLCAPVAPDAARTCRRRPRSEGSPAHCKCAARASSPNSRTSGKIVPMSDVSTRLFGVGIGSHLTVNATPSRLHCASHANATISLSGMSSVRRNPLSANVCTLTTCAGKVIDSLMLSRLFHVQQCAACLRLCLEEQRVISQTVPPKIQPFAPAHREVVFLLFAHRTAFLCRYSCRSNGSPPCDLWQNDPDNYQRESR
jgi:hypothetical protein